MQLILFSSPNYYKEEIELINQFLEDSFLILHLRKPSFSEEELRSFINEISVKFHPRIVIHSHLKLLNDYNLKGYHCTRFFLESNFKSMDQIRKLHSQKSFSRSCHSTSEIIGLSSYKFDYVFLSPVFESISKQDHKTDFDFEKIKDVLEKVDLKVFALGGIDHSKIDQIRFLNFSGIGILGAIWNNKSPKDEYQKIKELLFH